jgi:hypothetical protein
MKPTRRVDDKTAPEAGTARSARAKNAGMPAGILMKAPQVGRKNGGRGRPDGNLLHPAIPEDPTRSVDAKFYHGTLVEAPQVRPENGPASTKPIPRRHTLMATRSVDAHFLTLGLTGSARSAGRKISVRTPDGLRRVPVLGGGAPKGGVRRVEVEGRAVQWPFKITEEAASEHSLASPSATRVAGEEATPRGCGEGRPLWKLDAGVLQQRRPPRAQRPPRAPERGSNPEFSRRPAVLPMMKAKKPRRPAVLSRGSRQDGASDTGPPLDFRACLRRFHRDPPPWSKFCVEGALSPRCSPQGDSMSLEVRMDTSRGAAPPRRIRNAELVLPMPGTRGREQDSQGDFPEGLRRPPDLRLEAPFLHRHDPRRCPLRRRLPLPRPGSCPT